MVDDRLLATLALGAASLAALHALAPDHWAPFAAVARARGWSAGRTARVTALCAVGHVCTSAALGLLGLSFGVELLEAFGRRLETIAGICLIAFGLLYGAWGVRRAVGARLHGHVHSHYDHVHDPSRVTAWTLFLLFSADPCVAIIPLLFAAAPLGAVNTGIVVLTFLLSTIATMIVLVLPARAGARVLRGRWLERWGDAAAGGTIAVVGVAVSLLGW
jgi:hypothetical protein